MASQNPELDLTLRHPSSLCPLLSLFPAGVVTPARGLLPPGAHHPPPGFESAARREHAGERAALMAVHQHDEEERSAMLVSEMLHVM